MTQPPYDGTQPAGDPGPRRDYGPAADPYGRPEYPPPSYPAGNPASGEQYPGTTGFPTQPDQPPYQGGPQQGGAYQGGIYQSGTHQGPYRGGPYQGGPYQGGAAPGAPAEPAPKKRRALLITSIVLAVALFLCGGGGLAAWLLVGRSESGKGAEKPEAAVEAFLEAVYNDHDAKRAADLVCSEARDEKQIAKKVDEVKGYSDTYKSPRFAWDDPKVDNRESDRAIVSVKLRMTTSDEKIAEQQLRFTVVEKTGWWVCEVG